jgi:glucosyl-dolichyl phosphate glucuronosyltransferase
MPPLISVCVYTHNRARLLPRVLESICAQTLPQSEFEVIVVDNRSTDDTCSVVEGFFRRILNLRYLYEEKIGSAVARNRCWREASGEQVAFIDDDGKAPPDWLRVAAKVIRELAPDLFGGPIYPFYEAPKPDWFRDDYGAYSLGLQARFLMSPMNIS